MQALFHTLLNFFAAAVSGALAGGMQPYRGPTDRGPCRGAASGTLRCCAVTNVAQHAVGFGNIPVKVDVAW